MRVLYFLYFGALGAYWSYLNVYYISIGLSGTQVGLINTISPLVSIFSATLWSMVNDRIGRPRVVLRIAIPGAILGCLGISMVTNFTLIIVFSSMMSLFITAAIPLMDNTTLRLLGARRNQYGRYRVAGSVGFILTTLTFGFIYETTGLRVIFYSYAMIMTLYVIAASFLPNDPVRISGPVLGGVNKMIRQPAWVIFAICGLLLWVSNIGAMNFLGIVVKEMGGSDVLIGVVAMASAIAEIPIMLTSDKLLRRFGSTSLLIVAFCLFTLRGALLATMPAPEWAAGISTITGLSFSLFWVASVNYANEAAPDHLKTTAQGLLFSLMNLAAVSGSLGAGWLFDHIGFRGLFWTSAAVAAAALILFVAGRIFLHRKKQA